MSQFPSSGIEKCSPRRRGGRPVFGIIIALIGIGLLLHQLNLFPSIEVFSISWPAVMIVIGVALGFKRKWQGMGPYILIIVGIANLIPIFPVYGGTDSSDLIWPAVLVLVGLGIAFRNKKTNQWDKRRLEMVTNGESTLNIDVTMGGRKEIITSKEFRGGKISTTFGGTEVNLMQADSTVQPMVLDINVSFGSVELIVPSNWDVINDIRPSMGSVEDHRHMRIQDAGTEKRTLHLRGSCSFGSIEIKSY